MKLSQMIITYLKAEVKTKEDFEQAIRELDPFQGSHVYVLERNNYDQLGWLSEGNE